MSKFFFGQKKILLSISIIYIFFLKFDNIFNGFWYDEWHTFYYSNPNFLENGNLITLIKNSVAPPLYFILNSFIYKIFEYEPEIGRAISILFDILSFIILFFILKNNFSKKIKYYVLLGYLFNYSLIVYSFELRFYSFNTFTLLINIFFFFQLINNFSYKLLIYYLLTSLFCLSSNYFLIPIICFQFFYLLLWKKNFNFLLSILTFFLIFYLINQIHFLEVKNLSSKDIWGTFTYKFFISYYFNIFFGYKILGFIILSSILIIIFINFKKIIFNDKKLFIIICFIISTYIFFILYSVIFTPVLRPRYFLHIVPLIILVFFLLLDYLSVRKRFFIVFTFFFISFIRIYFFSLPFEKPDTNIMINMIKEKKAPIILDFKSEKYFFNHLINSHYFKKNQIKSFTNDQLNFINPSSFIEICLNNPSFKSLIKKDDPECIRNNYGKNYSIIDTLKTRDYFIKIYSKI